MICDDLWNTTRKHWNTTWKSNSCVKVLSSVRSSLVKMSQINLLLSPLDPSLLLNRGYSLYLQLNTIKWAHCIGFAHKDCFTKWSWLSRWLRQTRVKSWNNSFHLNKWVSPHLTACVVVLCLPARSSVKLCLKLSFFQF